jgi:hypothetical protein
VHCVVVGAQSNTCATKEKTKEEKNKILQKKKTPARMQNHIRVLSPFQAWAVMLVAKRCNSTADIVQSPKVLK